MQRDDDILFISDRLDAMYKGENRVNYDTIINIVNGAFNIMIEKDENDHHNIYWFNRKVQGFGSYDDDLATLKKYIIDIEKIIQ